MITFFKNFIAKILKHMFEEETEKMLVLKAKKLSITHNNFKKINDLSEVEFQVSSQWGEDGIIDWLFNKFKKLPKIFVEIGTQDYRESNTRFLLRNKNFDGYLIEGDSKATKNIKRQRIYWKHNIKVINKFVNLSNIDITISNLKLKKEVSRIYD